MLNQTSSTVRRKSGVIGMPTSNNSGNVQFDDLTLVDCPGDERKIVE